MEIQLIKWKKHQGEEFYRMSNEEELYHNMSSSFPKTLESCQELVTAFSETDDSDSYIRAITIDGVIAGCIAAYFEKDLYCRNAELAYWLAAPYRGHGIMTAMIRDVSDLLFQEYGRHRIYARPFEHNAASRKVLEKVGFKLEGILKDNVYKDLHHTGVYYSTALYGLISPQ